jgi:hypothetical protein
MIFQFNLFYKQLTLVFFLKEKEGCGASNKGKRKAGGCSHGATLRLTSPLIKSSFPQKSNVSLRGLSRVDLS